MILNNHPQPLLLYPPIESSDEFTDIYYRLLWYLNPVCSNISKLVVPYHGRFPQPSDIPQYIDPAVKFLKPNVDPLFQYINVEKETKLFFSAAADCQIVLLWKTHPSKHDSFPGDIGKELIATKTILNIDDSQDRNAGATFLLLAANLIPQQKALADSQHKFNQMVKSIPSTHGFILGTGPNVSRLLDPSFNFLGTTSIICNSLVKNKPLLEKVRPRIIAASDPIFHAGCSSYAGEFRAHLVETIRTYNCYFIVPLRDYWVYTKNLPPWVSNYIIGIPTHPNELPNLNLLKEFWLTYTSNILTLILLPLACTLFDEINIAGFDGRPLERSDYFWKHDPASQLNDQMDLIHQAHPAFFKINYDDYYLEHIQTTSSWLQSAFISGKKLINRTHSYIPALDSIYNSL